MQTEQLPRLEAGEYPGGIWYYEPHTYQLPLRSGPGGQTSAGLHRHQPSTAQPVRWTPP